MNQTKTQYQKRMRDLATRLAETLEALEDLATDLGEEAEGIEPYEGRDELTQAQEERQQWLEDAQSATSDLRDAIDDNLGDLEYLIY